MTAADIGVRVAVPADAEPVLALWREADAVPSVTDDAESIARIASLGRLLVATDDHGTVVGSVIAAFDGWRGHFYRLAVHPGWRRQGVGRLLIEAGERRLRADGARRAAADVVVDRTAARGVWEAAGYRPDGRTVRFVNDLPAAPA